MVNRPLTMRSALLAALAVVFVFAFSAVASAATVNLRVESAGSTTFNGQVSTTGGDVPTGSDCSLPGTSTVNQSTANPITALVAWASATGGTFNTGGGAFVCRIGADTGNKSVYWMMKINNKTQDGGTYLDGSTTVNNGDSVLWYFTDDYTKPTLSLALPGVAQTGVPISGNVSSYDGNDDSKSAASGASVSGGSANATSAADGGVSLTFPTAGRYLVSATKSGAIRASAWITVTDAPVPPPVVKTPLQLRVAARRQCLRDYKWHRTSSPRYKKCVVKANRIGKGK